jgi:ParB-like chromosome segregation protein Spo0J
VLPRIFTGLHVHGGATHFAERLPADKFKCVVLPIEVFQVREQRLRETGGRERLLNLGQLLFPAVLQVLLVCKC